MTRSKREIISKIANPEQHGLLRLALCRESELFNRYMNVFKARTKHDIINGARELESFTSGLSPKDLDVKMMAMIYSLSEKTSGWLDLKELFKAFQDSSLPLSEMIKVVISNPNVELFRVSDTAPVGCIEYSFGMIENIPDWAFDNKALIASENRRAANMPYLLPVLPNGALTI